MEDLITHLKKDSIKLMLPTQLWSDINLAILKLVTQKRKWHTFKYILNNGSINSRAIDKIDDTKGGIYVFSISPEIIPKRQRVLMYIGRALITTSENLKLRIRSYYYNFHGKENWERPKIQELFNNWETYMFCSYFEIDNNSTIEAVEDELINKLLPPCNSKIPDKKISAAVRAAGL